VAISAEYAPKWFLVHHCLPQYQNFAEVCLIKPKREFFDFRRMRSPLLNLNLRPLKEIEQVELR
jgi:hypothetical protein